MKPESAKDARSELERAVRSGFAPGLVGLIARGAERRCDAGRRDERWAAQPVARDTIFRIASMTKPITAIAAMMLVEEGKLALDEPIDRLAPELADRRVLKRPDGPLADTVPANRAITLEDVLSFRLGWGIDFERRGAVREGQRRDPRLRHAQPVGRLHARQLHAGALRPAAAGPARRALALYRWAPTSWAYWSPAPPASRWRRSCRSASSARWA